NNWKDPVTFRTLAANSITVNGAQRSAAASNGAFTFDGPTTFNANNDTSASAAGVGTITLGNFAHTLGADLIADDSNITINGDVTLSGAAGVDRTLNAGTGSVSVGATGSIDAGDKDLLVIANDVAFGGLVDGTG